MPTLNTFGSARGFGRAGAARPNQVTGLTATNVGSGRAFNNGRIDLAWTAPGNNGATITGYLIERSTNGSTYSTLVANTGNTNVSYSDTGLSSSQQYWYRVSAINAAGTGDASTAANATATTVPQAPTIGTATAGNGLATVAYTANATGGSAITGFTATSSPGSLTGTGASPITVSGLSNGTAYTFTVTATNANGTSAASAASNSITPQQPGVTWTSRTSNTGFVLRSVAYGNNVWVAGGDFGTVRMSTNGIEWTTQTSNFGNSGINGAAFGNGVFAIGGVSGQIRTSTDGITWTTRTSNFGTTEIYKIHYNGSLFMATGGGNNNAIARTSTDAISWTAVNPPQTLGVITYGNGTWVIAGYSGRVVTSTNNGTNWSNAIPVANNVFTIPSVSYGNGLFALTANTATLFTSNNGSTWTTRPWPSGLAGQNGRLISYGNGLWLLGNSAGELATSTDFVTWTTRQSNITDALQSDVNTPNTWVAVGENGKVITSGI